MINVFEVRETNKMIEESNLDVRTITMGISLLDCCDNNVDVVCEKIYRKITEKAANLVKVGDCLLYTSPSPRDRQKSRMPSSA